MDEPPEYTEPPERTGPSEAGSSQEVAGHSDVAAVSEGDAPASEHVRPPRQERSRKTLERIVDAARSLIAEEGVEAATVSRVVERADSSVGSFYARFDGKDDLLRYLEERVWAVARERWEEALASRSWNDLELEGVVRTVLRMLVRIEEEDAGARRALERGDGPARGLGAEARAFHARVGEDVRDLLLRYRDRFGHPSPERAAGLAYRWAVGGIRELLADRGDDAGGPPDPELVVDEASRALLGYLGGGVKAEARAEDVEFFDVWQ